MASRIPRKSAFCAARRILERRGLFVCGRREDHPPHDRQAVVSKNMCSFRHKPIPSAPSLRAFAASSPGVGVGADPEAA